MFGMFKKKSWRPEVLNEMSGNEGSLHIRLTNVPCLYDTKSGEHKYAWPDFGHDFLFALHQAIGRTEHACKQLNASLPVIVSVQLPNVQPIGVEISGSPNGNVESFESDLADAIISAFSAKGVKP